MNTELLKLSKEMLSMIDDFWRSSPTPERWFNGVTRSLIVEAIAKAESQ